MRTSCGSWLGCGRTRAAPRNSRAHPSGRAAFGRVGRGSYEGLAVATTVASLGPLLKRWRSGSRRHRMERLHRMRADDRNISRSGSRRPQSH
jgi:hypothetical protein